MLPGSRSWWEVQSSWNPLGSKPPLFQSSGYGVMEFMIMWTLQLEREENLFCVLRSLVGAHGDPDDFSTLNNSAPALWPQLANTRVSWCEKAGDSIKKSRNFVSLPTERWLWYRFRTNVWFKWRILKALLKEFRFLKKDVWAKVTNFVIAERRWQEKKIARQRGHILSQVT